MSTRDFFQQHLKYPKLLTSCVFIHLCACGFVLQELDEGECNGLSSVLVQQDYNAVKEDEICVVVGETVQILASNQQNMCLVYRPANSQSPAAEGWVPGHVLSSTR